MQFLGILLLVLQLTCVVHAVKTGRAYYWLWIILFMPGIGSLAYFIVELLPSQSTGSAVKKAGEGLIAIVNPGRPLRQLEEELDLCDNVKNRQALARGYMNAGRHDEAINLYQKCLTGVFKDDPAVLLELAYAYFLCQRFAEAKETIERLTGVHPGFHQEERQLLLARTCEETDDVKEALEVYRTMLKSSSGEEVRCRYALLLDRTGEHRQAFELFSEVLIRARRSPRYYRRAQKQWIKLAKQYLAQQAQSR